MPLWELVPNPCCCPPPPSSLSWQMLKNTSHTLGQLPPTTSSLQVLQSQEGAVVCGSQTSSWERVGSLNKQELRTEPTLRRRKILVNRTTFPWPENWLKCGHNLGIHNLGYCHYHHLLLVPIFKGRPYFFTGHLSIMYLCPDIIQPIQCIFPTSTELQC